MENTVRVP